MNPITSLILPILLLFITVSVCSSARPESTAELKHSSNDKPNNQNNKGGGTEGGPGGFFGPGGGFGIPGFGSGNGNGNGIIGGGYGSGFGGPNGGYSKGGINRPSVVCKEKGPCYKKKLTCPTKCFTSYRRSGKGYGGGGGGGGCTMDCKKKCTAYC